MIELPKEVTVDISRNSPIFRNRRDLRNRKDGSTTQQREHTGSSWAIAILGTLKFHDRGQGWQLSLFDGTRGRDLLALGANPDRKETYRESKDS
jgi:hypothetical protein